MLIMKTVCREFETNSCSFQQAFIINERTNKVSVLVKVVNIIP